MDFISCFSSLPRAQFQSIRSAQKQSLSYPLTTTNLQLKKIQRLFSGRLKGKHITFNYTFLNPQNQVQCQENQNQNQSLKNPNDEQPMHILEIKDALNFSIVQKTKLKDYEIFINFAINIQRAAISFQSTIIKNFKQITVQSKSLMKFMARYFVSQNARIQFGSFFIHPLLKKLTFSIYNHQTLDRISSLMRNPQKFLNFFIEQVDKLIVLWNNHIQPIMHIINKRPFHQQKSISKQPSKSSIKFNYVNQKLKKISNMIIHSHIEALFFVENKNIPRFKKMEDQERNLKVQQTKRQIMSMQNKVKSLSPLYPCISAFIGKKKITTANFKYPQWQVPQMREVVSNLACIQYGGKFPIYSQIQVLSVQKETCIFQSGFSRIFILDGIMKRQNQQPTRSRLVKKITQQKRYRNQVEVLKILHNQKCLFFPRYFFCQQQEYKQSILLEYIPQSSIDRYIQSRSTFIGNQTKLFFLFQIIVALRFLRDNSIVHIDLKPQNVLLKIVGDLKQSVHYLIKLIDFGESYSSKVQQLSNKSSGRGFTIPYAPPQLLSKAIKFDQKTDVYSFGVIMFEIMFQYFPIEILRLDKAGFIDQEYLKFFSMPYERLVNYGTHDVMIMLYYLCLKCLQPEPSDRPTLDWLNIILKDLVLIYEQLAK